MVSIDHISIGVQNLYEGTHRFREDTGFNNYDGGWFPGAGIANKIIPLGGDTYIEIESVIDSFQLERTPAIRWFRDATAKGDVFIGWCARADSEKELEQISKRLGKEPVKSAMRVRPDGSSKIAIRVPETIECWPIGMPNFFYTPDMAEHPGRPAVDHRVTPHGIAWMELGGTEEAMSDWLGVKASSLGLRFNGKAQGLYAMGVKTGNGIVEIRKRSLLE